MPGPKSDRRLITIRLGQTGLAAIDAQAAKQGLDRSAMIRLLIAAGMKQLR